MAVGRSNGDDRARKAAEMAISSPLLDVTIDGARGILFNITGGPNLSLFEVNEAAAMIRESAHPDVNIIFGAQIDESMGDELRITVIATGFEQSRAAKNRPELLGINRPQVAQPVQRAAMQQPAMQRPLPQQPAAPAQPKAFNPPTPAPRQAPPPAEQPAPREYGSWDKEDLDIPAFLRNKRKD